MRTFERSLRKALVPLSPATVTLDPRNTRLTVQKFELSEHALMLTVREKEYKSCVDAAKMLDCASVIYRVLYFDYDVDFIEWMILFFLKKNL